MIVALVSSYREGRLLEAAVASAVPAADRVLVLDGPIGPEWEGTTWVPGSQQKHLAAIRKMRKVTVREGRGWADDASKRNELLAWCKEIRTDNAPLWAFWIDGDEIMVWGEYLPDLIASADEQMGPTGGGGFSIRIVEMDGSVALMHGRVIRPEVIEELLVSFATFRTRDGQIIQAPNEKVCGAGGIPFGAAPMVQNDDQTLSMAAPGSPELEGFLAKHRPPVAGEPHFLHRAALRVGRADVIRQHLEEGKRFDELVKGTPAEGTVI